MKRSCVGAKLLASAISSVTQAGSLTHGITVSRCMCLMFSGAFWCFASSGRHGGPDVVFAFRMSHRILGVVFVVPIISAIMAPAGVKHIIHATMHLPLDRSYRC